jgi:hypothetical protein
MVRIALHEGVDVYIDDITREINIQAIIPDVDIKKQKGCDRRQGLFLLHVFRKKPFADLIQMTG